VAEAGTARQRLGVFGSAFNPPQNAHLSVVEAAMAQLGLERLIAVPTGHAYHKESEADPGPAVRLRMAQAAFRGIPGVSVSSCEVEREGPSYTYVTLEEIEAENPDSEIHLLMGADTARDFGGWKRPERILELARIAIAPRPEVARSEVLAAFDALGASGRVAFLDMPPVDLSSSLVRGRIETGQPVAGMVPAAVAQIIDNEGVYGSEQ
jgi:nicotinate-nucleotide adenylyltransferase